MLSQSSADLLKANNGLVYANSKINGLETKLKWQNANYALEFTYDEGFEFEQVIPMSELSDRQQDIVHSKANNADKVVVEVVHTINSESYEAYYFRKNQLIEKLDFR